MTAGSEALEARRPPRGESWVWRFSAHRHAPLVLLIPALLLLAGVYLVPLGQIVFFSFGKSAWSVSHYVAIVQEPANLLVLGRTIRLSIEVALLCLLLGYPVAYLLLISSTQTRRILVLLIISVLWTTVLVRTYAWMVILGREGLVNGALQWIGLTEAPMTLLFNRFAVYVGMVHIMLPFMILPLFSAMRRIDMRLALASRSLGAGPIATFALIIIPLSIPGVFAGTLLVAILSLGFFVTPALLGGLRDITFVMLIERYVNVLARFEVAAAMSIVLLLVTLALVFVYQRILAPDDKGTAKRTGGSGPRWLVVGSMVIANLLGRVWRRSAVHEPAARGALGAAVGSLSVWWRRLPFSAAMGWTVIAFMVAPVTIIFPLSFSSAAFLQFPPPGFSLQWFEKYFSRPDWIEPTLMSFKVAGVTMVIATVVGLLAAIPLTRSQFPGKRFVLALMLSPMIVPTIVLAVAFYLLFVRLHLIGTMFGLVLAHTVLALPYVVVVISGALQSTGVELERAAQTLGANPARAFVRVTLPMIKPAVFTAALFSFLVSFEELVIALFISGVTAKTLPKRMWDGIREEIDPTIAAVAAMLTVFSLVLLFAAETIRSRAEQTRGLKSSPEALVR